MNNRIILNTIRTYKELDMEELMKYDLGVEIQDFTEPNLSDEKIEYIVGFYKNKFKNFQGIKSMHGPFIDLKPASPDRLIREASHIRYKRAMDIAVELDMDYIVFHSQINPNHIGEFMEELNAKQSADFWNGLMEEYKEYKGIVVIENVFENDPKMIRRLLDKIDLGNVKMNLDIGHAKLSGRSLEEWIYELQEYIAYMHIHSNDGKFDKHERPSKKEIIDLYVLLDKFNINPVLSLEYLINDMIEELQKYR